MKLVYVAGPFSGPTRADVERNICNAECTGVLLAQRGVFPVIPHANTSDPDFEKVQPYQFWIEGTMKLMEKCDAVFMTGDWQNSKGATAERERALELGIPVFEHFYQVTEWIVNDS